MSDIEEIYKLIAKQRQRFVEIAARYTNTKDTIDDVVQEQMLYFMQMNKKTLIDIYEKDGIEGIIRYGAVAIHRAITSPRSTYYYKYRKYYTHIIGTGNSVGGYRSTITEVAEPIDEDLYKKQLIKKIGTELDKMYWYDSKVFTVYYEEKHTLDSLAKKTGISRNSLHSTIKKVKNKLIEIFEDELFCEE